MQVGTAVEKCQEVRWGNGLVLQDLGAFTTPIQLAMTTAAGNIPIPIPVKKTGPTMEPVLLTRTG